MSGLKTRIRKKMNDPPAVKALLLAMLAAFCLLLGMTAKPTLYPADYGRYERYLKDCGLMYTEADLEKGGLIYERGLREFSYAHFSYARLLSPDAVNPNAYVIALVRLFTKPFTDTYHVSSGMAVWAVILVAAVFWITRALAELKLKGALIPGIVLSLIFTDGNFAAMFKGLYPEGAAIALSLVAAGAFLSIYAELRMRENSAGSGPDQSGESNGVKIGIHYGVFLVSTLILIRTMPTLLVFVPVCAFAWIFLLVKISKRWKNPVIIGLFAAVLIISGIRSAMFAANADPDYSGYPAAYESLFNTALPEVGEEEQSAFLCRIGLDPTYAGDIGKSYYQDESDYVHCPRDEKSNEDLKKAVTTRNVFRFYLTHPAVLMKCVSAFGRDCTGYVNAENRSELSATGRTTSWTGDGLIGFLRLMVRPSYPVYLILTLMVCIIFLVRAVKRRSIGAGIGAAVFFSAAVYVPAVVILNGAALESETVLYQTFLTDMVVLILAAVFYEYAGVFERWAEPDRAAAVESAELLEGAELAGSCDREEAYCEAASENDPAVRTNVDVEPDAKQSGKHRSIRSRLLSRRGIIVLTAGILSIFMMMVLMKMPHAGLVNNGDFGRMMEQLDITWTGDLFYDTSAQLSHYVIEEYAYQAPFDPLKLTPLRPTYSLYYFVSLLRLMEAPFTDRLNTFHLEVMMSLIMLLCIVIMTADLYRLIGKWSLMAGLLLGTILFSETYLVWFNGLFGEGSILLGVLMTLMCALHLAAMEKKGGIGSLIWLLLLAVSLNILLTAKAQMLMCLPAAVILFLTMAVVHCPFRYDFRVLYAGLLIAVTGVICAGTLAVYRTDRTETSVSEKHTLWQAYFYGIFMISDDPIKDMEDLGIDTKMAADIGKYVDFNDDSKYVYAPLSDEAQEAFYDHVSTGTILKWYLTHPTKLMFMLNHAASEANSLYTDFRAYTGQDYSDEHDKVDGMGLWLYWRPYLMPKSFAVYVVIYLVFFWYIVRSVKGFVSLSGKRGVGNGDESTRDSDCDSGFAGRMRPDSRALSRALLAAIIFFIMFAGAVQFPLSVLGNGFADNHKQLFGFSLCMDLLFVSGITIVLRRLCRKTIPEIRVPWIRIRM